MTNLGKEAVSCEDTRQHPEVEDVLQSNGQGRSTTACKGHTYEERKKKKTQMINRVLLKVN